MNDDLTLRDFFAAFSLVAKSCSSYRGTNCPTTDAKHAYKLADAMIEARKV